MMYFYFVVRIYVISRFGDLNPRLPVYKTGALPTELKRPRFILAFCVFLSALWNMIPFTRNIIINPCRRKWIKGKIVVRNYISIYIQNSPMILRRAIIQKKNRQRSFCCLMKRHCLKSYSKNIIIITLSILNCEYAHCFSLQVQC